jgi:hypothetical protein
MMRHQHASTDGGGAANQATAQSSQSPAVHANEAPLQFDSNMDWPTSNEARHPLPFPTAHMAPCARITTRIYHPPHLAQGGLIGGVGNIKSGSGYTQQAQQGRVETVRDVLVEIAGPSRDEMGRPIVHVPMPTQPTSTSQQQTQSQQVVAQRIGGRTFINDPSATGVGVVGDDSGAGFTGAGEFMLGGMANAVSVTGHASGSSNVMQGADVGGTGSALAGAADDGDDSMSSGWSTSDSEMSFGNNISGPGGNMAGSGGPTRPNAAFAGAGGGDNQPHHHHQYHPPQRAYLLQRTLREAIYGRVRYGIVLERRQQPPDCDTSSAGAGGHPMAEWEVTDERCAIKEMSWQHIRKERNRLAEDPIKVRALVETFASMCDVVDLGTNIFLLVMMHHM